MADIIINRHEKTVHILTEYLNRHYIYIDDNVDSALNSYLIDIEYNNVKGQIKLPKDKTNLIILG